MTLKRAVATRYVQPLREGGSLPAIVDTDLGEQFVVKFRGAGQGPKALVAEAIAAGLATAIGLPVPNTAVIEMAEGFGAGEPDPEIQDLLRGSIGENFGIAYLDGAFGFELAADRRRVDAALASAIVWFDALITNVDRTPRNPNLLVWHDRLWLIDHGASLYFHHREGNWVERADHPFAMIDKHILLGLADEIAAADARLRPLLTRDVIRQVIDVVPESWLGPDVVNAREEYIRYLDARLASNAWLEEAENARRRL